MTFSEIAAGSYGDKTIEFSTAMASAPHVVAMRSGAGTVGYDIQLATVNTSSSGFLLRCWNFGANSITPKIAWIAACQ